MRRLETVIGRARNLLQLPDGRPFSPSAIRGETLAKVLDHREWQLVQMSLSDLTFNVVTPRPPTAEQTQALRAYLDAALPAHRTTIAFVDAIANPMANGKPYEPFLSLVERPA